MLERTRFVLTHQEGLFSMTELCERFSISRKTGYLWLARFSEEGLPGLEERSRAPRSKPHQMAGATSALLIETRRKHPTWGPRKLLAYLRPRHPGIALPAPSTVGDLLKRSGLVEARRRRRAPAPAQHTPRLEAALPNQVWAADFKGEFRLGSGPYCYPLTVTDAASRYLLACRALPSTSTEGALRSFEQLFRARGLPEAIRTDNGTPFASPAIGGLSRLNVYWAKLGILHQRIEPGRPEQNGRHERMHRTLKAEATRPPGERFDEQQERFDGFAHEYDEERPHEALGHRTPASCYRAPERRLPERVPGPEYPAYYEVRRVDANGTFKFKGAIHFLSQTLAHEQVGLAETEDGIWSIYFYERLLTRFDERRQRLST